MTDKNQKVARGAKRMTSGPRKLRERCMMLNVCLLGGDEDRSAMILLAIEDITGRKVPRKEDR